MINEYLNKVIKSICNIDINQLIVDMSIKKQEVSCLKGELTHFKNENYSKSAQIVQMKSEINNQKDEINTLKRHNVELSSMLDSNKADINSLQNERNNLYSDIANKLRIINEQILQNTNLQEQLNQTISALQSSNQEYTRLQEYSIQMRNKCSELEQNLQSVSDEKAALSSNVAELQSQIADKNSEIERLKEKDNLASAANEELLRNQGHLYEEISSIRAEKDTLLQQLESALQSSNQEYTRLQEYSIQMRNKCSELEQTIQSISDEKAALSSNVAELQSQIADKNSEIGRLKEKDNQASAANEELLHNQGHLYEEISSIRAEKDTLLQQLEEKRIRSEQELEEYKQTIESLLSEKLALITQVDTLQNNIADYKSKVEMLEEDNNQLPVSNEEVLPNQTLLQDESSIVNEEKDLPLQHVEEEIQINEQQVEESSQTVELISTEDDLPEIVPIYQDSVEEKNDFIEDKQEETIIDTNTIDEDDVEIVNVEPIISTDIEVDSNDVKGENSDFLEHPVADESSTLSLSVTTDEDIDETTTIGIETETEDKQDEASTDATMIDVIETNDDEQEDDGLPYFYDNSLIPADKLSIPEVYDVKEGKTINSRDFFSQNENELILWRRNLQEEYLMGHARFICPECKQPVKISGHKLARGRVCYFAHFKDSDDCQYKTGTHRTKEEIERLKYSLVQESDRHKRLKSVIASALKGERSMSMGVENVECEKRIKSDIPYLNWRRPDIYAEYNGRKFVFELQLSTTFVSVVVDRDIFYRLNDYNIIWVFNFEDNAEYVNLHNLMCKDIYYANKRNVFIFDADAEERSKEKGELVLKCRWLDENGQWSSDQYVTLDMLQYDEENHKAFVFDADKVYLENHPELKTIRKQLEHTREYLLQGLINRLKEEEKIKQREQDKKDELRNLLLENNDMAEIVEVQGKFGLSYKGNILLSPEYTFIDKFDSDGFAKVYSGKYCGMATKDGRLVVPCEFKSIYMIDAKQELFFALYQTICLFLNGTRYEIMDIDMKRDEIISKKTEFIHSIILAKKGAYNRSKREYAMTYYNLAQICNDYALLRGDGKFFGYDYSTLKLKDFDFKEMEFTPIDGVFIVSDGVNYGIATEEPKVILPLEYKGYSLEDKNILLQNTLNKYGFYTVYGQEIIPCKYDFLTLDKESNLWIYKLDDKYGLLNTNGDVLTNNLYSEFEFEAKKRTFKAYVSYKHYVTLDANGQIIETESKAIHNDWIIKHSGNSSSIMAKDTGEIILDYEYEFEEFANQRIKIIDDTSWYSKKYYIADESGTKLSDSYTSIDEFDGNSAKAVVNYRKGNIDINGQKTRTFIKLNDKLSIFHVFEESWGLQSADGNILFDDTFKKIEQLYPDDIILKIIKNNSYYYNECALFRNDNEPLNFEYRDIMVINDIYFKLKTTDDTYELMKRHTPSYLLAGNYRQLDYLYDNVFVVATNDKDGKQIINDTGKVLAEINYTQIEHIEDKFLKVRNGLKYGVIDIYGNIILPVGFTLIEDFVNQSAKAKIGDYEGNVSLAGFQEASIVEDCTSCKLCVSFGRYFFSKDGIFKNHLMTFECVKYLKNNLYAVKQSLWGVYDVLKSKMIIDPNYSDIENRTDGYIGIKANEQWGIADDNGRILIYPRYESISEFDKGKAIAIRNNCSGIVTLNGNELYETIENQYNWTLKCKFNEYTFLDSNNNSIFNFIFGNLEKISDGFYLVTNWESNNKVVLNPNTRKQKTFRGDAKLLTSPYYAVFSYKKWHLYRGFEQIGDFGYYDIQPLGKSIFAVKTSWYNWNVLEANGEEYNHCFSDRPELLSGNCYYIIGYYKSGLYYSGKLLIDNIDKVEKITENRFVISLKNKGKVIVDNNGSTITKTEYFSITYNEEQNNFIVETKPDQQGVIDYNGNFSPDNIYDTDTGEFQIIEHLGKTGVKNKVGVFVLPLSFENKRIVNNIIKEIKANSYNFTLKKIGEEIISIENVLEVEIISEKILLVKKNTTNNSSYYSYNALWGALNNNFEEIIPFKYVSLNVTDDNKIIAKKSNGSTGTYDFNGNFIIDKTPLIANLILTKRFDDYGLEDSDGKEIISLDKHCSEITIIGNSCLRICKNNLYALYDTSGIRLSDFKYSSITIETDGAISCYRNNQKGTLDENGNEVADFIPFNGGYICSAFGEYSVVDETKTEVIIPKTNSKIELLDEDGVFSLYKNGKFSLANKSKNVETITYDSVRKIGNGFFVVARNPYSFYKKNEYGIIDKNLKTIVPCKYKSISGFDSNGKLEAKMNNGKNVTFSLAILNRKSTGIMDLTTEVEYQAKVKGFLSIGIIVEINDSTYIIHKKYLYKSKSEFTKGEILIAKYLSNDKDGHPVWETNSCAQEPVEELTENKN